MESNVNKGDFYFVKEIERVWIELLEKAEERRQNDLKELNEKWKRRLCVIENAYRQNLKLNCKKPEDYMDEIPLGNKHD